VTIPRVDEGAVVSMETVLLFAPFDVTIAGELSCFSLSERLLHLITTCILVSASVLATEETEGCFDVCLETKGVSVGSESSAERVDEVILASADRARGGGMAPLELDGFVALEGGRLRAIRKLQGTRTVMKVQSTSLNATKQTRASDHVTILIGEASSRT